MTVGGINVAAPLFEGGRSGWAVNSVGKCLASPHNHLSSSCQWFRGGGMVSEGVWLRSLPMEQNLKGRCVRARLTRECLKSCFVDGMLVVRSG